MTAQDAPAVIHNSKTRIQIGIVAEHILHDIVVEAIAFEELVVAVGLEEDIGTVLVLRVLSDVADEFSTFKDGFSHLSIAKRVHLEVRRERVDRLDADTIQTNRLLESLRVVLTASVQHADSLDHLALRNATTIVTNRDTKVVFNVDFDAVASLHLKLIDGVVDDLLQQHIDAILGKRAVAQSSDVHTRTQANMLCACQGFDVVVAIFGALLGDDDIFFVHRFFLKHLLLLC